MSRKSSDGAVARRVSIASLGAPQGPVKFSVGSVRRFVAMTPEAARTAIMRRGLPGRPKKAEKAQREAMADYVGHIQGDSRRKRAWLAKSAPGKTGVVKPAVQAKKKATAHKTKLQAAKITKQRPSKEALSRQAPQAATAKKKSSPPRAKVAAKPGRKKNQDDKVLTAVSKRIGTAKKVAKVAKKVVERTLSETLSRLKRSEAAKARWAEKKAKAAQKAAAAPSAPEPNAFTYPEHAGLDERDRRDIEKGLPIWVNERQEESVPS